MSRLLTIIGAILFPMLTQSAALALPASPAERAQLFANCAGRYAAITMHESFFDGAASELAETRYRLFVDMLDAVRDDAMTYGVPGRMLLHWRVEAKARHATLLHRATFHEDVLLADASRNAADRFLTQCNQLLLGS